MGEGETACPFPRGESEMSTPNGSLSPEGRRRNCPPLPRGESEMSTPNGSLSPPGRGLG